MPSFKGTFNKASESSAADDLKVLRAANRIAHLLSRAERVEGAVEQLMQEFLQIADAEEGSIQLLRPSSQRTQRTLIRGGKTTKKLFENRIDDLMTGWVVKHGQPLISNDVAAAFNLGKTAERFAAIRSILATPIRVNEQIIGVANLARSHGRKPFSTTDLELISALADEISPFIEQAQLREQLFDENERLRHALSDRSEHGILGHSPAMKQIFALLERVIPTDGRIMLQGESGTGKEMIAKYIHNSGPRQKRPFIAIDCGALPPNLLESELFGYVRGAFTGADRDRPGLFEEADGGTLFLDEIGNMSLEIQAKFLRVLQEGEVRPLGSNQARSVDVRVIVAASQDLQQKSKSGEFRQDLFYRLNVVPIRLPALRERVEDIPVLANYFLKRYATKYNKPMSGISSAAICTLENYDWPGNVRELENAIERAVILSADQDAELMPAHLPAELTQQQTADHRFEIPLKGDLPALLEDYEREIIKRVLQHNKWNKSAAANALNISERVMRYKIKRLGLKESE